MLSVRVGVPWSLHEFRVGLVLGVVTAGALLLAGLVAAAVGRGRPVPVGGVVIASAGLWSIADARPVPIPVLVGVAGIGCAAALASLPWGSLWYSAALAIPFAWIISFHSGLVAVTWARVLVGVAASGGAMLVTAFDHAWREEALGLTLLTVTAVGMYATVPDTEAAAAALGVVLPFVVLGWPARIATLGCAGAAAAFAMLVWAGAAGAEGRPSSTVGLVTCIGLLAGVPVGTALFPRASAWLRCWPRFRLILAMVTSHALLVIAASRTAGQVSDPGLAGAIAAVVGVTAALVGAGFGRPAAS